VVRVAGAARRTAHRLQRGETRARIVAAAEEELRSRPLRDVSVEEVMERAQLTRTLFYRHFDDLFDLVVSVARPAFDELFATDQQILGADPSDPDRLRQALAPAVALFAQHGPLIRAVAEASVFDAGVEAIYRGALERFGALTERFLEQVGAPVADHAQTARALTFLNVGYLLDTFGTEPRATPDEATSTLLELWRAVTARRT
jgi:AcrR family transcriptional regulator